MKDQQVFYSYKNNSSLLEAIKEKGGKRVLLVNGGSLKVLKIDSFVSSLEADSDIEVIYFSDFGPNPTYDSVIKGVDLWHRHGCNLILAVGGGSAMDVAKCIKLFSNMRPGSNYIEETIVPSETPFYAVPTTAGSGSEATRYAIIYVDGEKITITDDSCLPDCIFFNPSVLDTLPYYQKCSTMIDALCHAIESYWSVDSTEQSRSYAIKAIMMVMANREKYLNNDYDCHCKMFEAANIAGKAINITRTTVAHAMCYKITSLYGLAHGHATAICLGPLWSYMIDNIEKYTDPRGVDHLRMIFQDLAYAMGVETPMESVEKFEEMLEEYGLGKPLARYPEELDLMVGSVNLDRIENTPVEINMDDLRNLYRKSVLYQES